MLSHDVVISDIVASEAFFHTHILYLYVECSRAYGFARLFFIIQRRRTSPSANTRTTLPRRSSASRTSGSAGRRDGVRRTGSSHMPTTDSFAFDDGHGSGFADARFSFDGMHTTYVKHAHIHTHTHAHTRTHPHTHTPAHKGTVGLAWRLCG